MTESLIVKRLLSLRNSQPTSKLHNLRTLLYDDIIWKIAYQNIYSNKGAFTIGVDPTDTLDNFNLDRINKIITSIKTCSYQPNPVRRVNIPKSNGNTRSLGISTGNDKLVQEAIRIILEAIYEPKFSNNSHGFRPNRSCHTSLKDIAYWAGTKWWIEFDIEQCFNNIDHNILIKILEKRIDDPVFIGFIRKFLNAGYLENWKYHNTFSGTPQGSGLSPILANIYLNELDQFIDQKCQEINSRKEARDKNKEYQKCTGTIFTLTKSLNLNISKKKEIEKFISDNIDWNSLSFECQQMFNEGLTYRYGNPNGNKKYYRLSKKLSEILNLDREDIGKSFRYNQIKETIEYCKIQLKKEYEIRSNLRSRDFSDTDYNRLYYTRYADDFILGYIGTKNRAEEIFQEIIDFLKNNLNLEISRDKSKVVFGSDGVSFLGYKISIPKFNKNEKTSYIRDETKIISRRNINNPIFKVPTEKMISFVNKRGYGSYVENRSDHRTFLQNFDDLEILKQYNSELQGLWNYYRYAVNAKDLVGKVQWLWQYSFLKTLGLKHRCSVSQVFKRKIVKTKNVITHKYWYLEVNEREFPVFNLREVDYINIRTVKKITELTNDTEYTKQFNFRNSAVRKLEVNECEMCGKLKDHVSIFLHHPNQIRNIDKNLPIYEKVKRVRSRKTIALCHECHMKTHHG